MFHGLEWSTKGPRCLWLNLGALLLLLAPVQSFADRPTSYKLAHPVVWRYNLPTGEQPGWSSNFWLNLETSVQNTWNKPLTMTNLANGDTLEAFFDYEQYHAILEMGGAITDRFAMGIEIPYAYQGGGFLDQIIDDFHVAIGAFRYRRENFPTNDFNFSTETNGTEHSNGENQAGVDNIKIKMKYWLWQWMGAKRGTCSCGFSVALHHSFPLKDNTEGRAGTNGENSSSVSFHLGIPMFQDSAIWITSAFSHVPEDNLMPDWPRNTCYQMYEFSMDVGITDAWGFILQVRADSPILNENLVRYEDAASSTKVRLDNRRASGYNGLVHWRGSQSFGFRYRHSESWMSQFLFLEDWTYGNFDQTNDSIFVHNAPDMALTYQTSFGF